jgi:putative methyltransferase
VTTKVSLKYVKFPRTCLSQERSTDEPTELAEGVIRCLPEDKTNGFFVACFIRGQPASASSTEVSKKRPIDEDELLDDMSGTSDAEDEDIQVADPKTKTTVTMGEKTKTAAQAERLRRKKQLQKKKRKVAQ